MLFNDDDPQPIYLARDPVDFRKQINGLLEIVAREFSELPQTAWFVFINRARDKAKVLFWHHNGFTLWYKRLEKGRFTLSPLDDQHITLDRQQLDWLLCGYDWACMSGMIQPNLQPYQHQST
jgi:transposase